MEEIWKTISGTDNKYSVSNLGNVKRNEHYTIVGPIKGYTKEIKQFYKERPIKKYIDCTGYETVKMIRNNKIKTLKVHRLVAEAFIPNPNNYEQVNHLNEIKCDNRVDNLEWCSSNYNANYGTRNKRISKVSGIKVAQYTKTGELIKIWDSLSQASRYFGCKSTSCIRRVCKGEIGRNTYKGFCWKYVDSKVIGDKHLKKQMFENKNMLLDLIVNTFTTDEIERILNNMKN